jgi:hypothetical protein
MMGENSNMRIKDFQTNQQKSTKSSVLTVIKGKVMFYALRLFKHRSNSMIVETPTAVCGVRGTKWGVEVIELEGRQTASLPVLLADSSNMGYSLLAQANPPSPPQFQTTILCFSGTVFTGSTAPPPPGAPPPPVITLSQGQMTTVGTGQPPAPPSITPPSLANSFTAGTFAPPPGGSGAPPSSTLLPGSSLMSSVDQVVTIPPPTHDTSNLAQQQNQQQTATRPTTHYGFASVILQNDSGPSYDAHLINATPWNFNGSSIELADPFGSQAQLKANGSGSYSTPSITYLKSGAGYAIDSGLPVSVSSTELGYNAYTEWGYWSQPQKMTYSGDIPINYTFVDKGYYIMGDLTTDAQIAALRTSGVVGNYTGNAYGTHFYNGSTTEMTGTFRTTINFATSAVSDFNVNVSGGGQSASITGAIGTLSGTTGNFSISGGTFAISAGGMTPPLAGTAVGAVYGNNGQAVGGVWGIKSQDGGYPYHATGVFQGTR